MAVAGLSGRWILEVLTRNHPEGVLRRALLEEFGAVLVTPRSSRGALGRVARRLYAKLNMLQRRGRVAQEDGIIRPLGDGRKPQVPMPELGPVLRKLLFLALLIEDRTERPDAPDLRRARWEFLARAIEQGWTRAQAAEALGMAAGKAEALVANPPRRTPEAP